MNRRSFLSGLIAAPAVITTPGLLMPIKPWIEPTFSALGGEWGPIGFAGWVLYNEQGGAKTYVRSDLLTIAGEVGVAALRLPLTV